MVKTLVLDYLSTEPRACLVGSPRNTSIARTRLNFENFCSACYVSHVKPPSLPAGHRAPQTCLSANTHQNLHSATSGASGTENVRPSKELGTFRYLSGVSLGEVSGPQNRPKHSPLLSLPLQHELPRTSSSCPSAMLCSGGSIWAAGW